ncbi:hypothetical protein RCC94_14520 [Exiguobacterium acetylicum]|uniref:hypothetical protein n=2 Tax=Exiguobacterium TaxID=33986 RepID=UPI000A7744CC|nr:hypothetical protein [Exiguobacterium acetylicum]MDQ6468708.1 hypothetical protein [Exiguobacterium acetylicum]
MLTFPICYNDIIDYEQEVQHRNEAITRTRRLMNEIISFAMQLRMSDATSLLFFGVTILWSSPSLSYTPAHHPLASDGVFFISSYRK